MIGRNENCWCGSEVKYKKCCSPKLPPHAKEQNLAHQYIRQYNIRLKTPKQIAGIREASRLAAKILDKLCKHAKKGVTTDALNTLANELHKEAGATPAPLHYGQPPFPKSICTSLNEVVCHGIPDDRPLQEGDILNIDVTSILDGYYGDCSRMVTIGKPDPEKQRVVDVAYECLMRSIAPLKPGVMLCEIGDTITEYATANSCSVVHQFVGHGIGLDFHEPPQILHTQNTHRIPLAPGMTFTIEPMINAGVAEAIIDPKDRWTARTADGKPSAQWEHTVLITDDGHDILTLAPR